MTVEVGESLRNVGFEAVKPVRGGPGEKEFQGGLGPKKVDVSYSDQRHGLLLAVSIKSINFAPFGKNLPNRFADLCTEAINPHMRFPYSVVCGLFVFPESADQDDTGKRRVSTFQRAVRLFGTISGRVQYTDPPEKFESVAIMLYRPVGRDRPPALLKLVETVSGREMSEHEYFLGLRDIFNARNPHASVGETDEDLGSGSEGYKDVEPGPAA